MRASLGPTVCIFPIAKIPHSQTPTIYSNRYRYNYNLPQIIKKLQSERLDVQTLHRHTIYKFRACAILPKPFYQLNELRNAPNIVFGLYNCSIRNTGFFVVLIT